MNLAGSVKLAVAEYRNSEGKFPTQASSGVSSTITGNNVSGIAIGGSGQITITYSNDTAINGSTLILVPTFTGGSVSWTCNTGTVAPKYRPSNCR
jgi:type IV pilus assembly protein PilA